MDERNMAEIREHYDRNCTEFEMDGGLWETGIDPNPMVTTSLRLPKDVLDWVRVQAAEQRVKPTALIRQWIEERRLNSGAIEARIARLEDAVFRREAS